MGFAESNIACVIGDALIAAERASFRKRSRPTTTGDIRGRLIVAEASKGSVFAGERLIDAHVELGFIQAAHGRVDKVDVSISVACIRCGVQVDHGLPNGIEEVGWNLVTWSTGCLASICGCREGVSTGIALECTAGVRIDDCKTGDGIAKWVSGEIAGPHGQRRHEACKGDALALEFLFAIDEEEGFVFDDGAADGAAELVQVELGGCLRKVVPGIQVGIAHKFEERPVKGIGPGLCADQHGRTRSCTVLGGVGVGQNLELLNVVDRGEDADTARGEFVIIDAIQQPISTVRT